jgi:[protein-PII] uridylyltransferase
MEPVVEIAPDRRPGRWVVSVSCADRPGLLSSVSRVFVRHGLNLVDARVATLGNRAEDTFVVNGPALDEPPSRIAITGELRDLLAP